MDDVTFTQHIRQVREQSLPATPLSIEANVLRSVHQAQATQPASLLPSFNRAFLNYSFALATLAVVTGISSAVAISSIQIRQENRQRYALEALNFDAFTLTKTVQFKKH